MDIVIDVELDEKGEVIARHIFTTDKLGWNVCAHPNDPTVIVDAMFMVVERHQKPELMAGSGWDILSKHPVYPGKTRHDVLLAEIIRLNDPVGRKALGI
jgi:hypothetical protein